MRKQLYAKDHNSEQDPASTELIYHELQYNMAIGALCLKTQDEYNEIMSMMCVRCLDSTDFIRRAKPVLIVVGSLLSRCQLSTFTAVDARKSLAYDRYYIDHGHQVEEKRVEAILEKFLPDSQLAAASARSRVKTIEKVMNKTAQCVLFCGQEGRFCTLQPMTPGL